MGRAYSFDDNLRDRARRTGVHPVWRGIGCILVVLIPLMAFAGAVVLVDANAQKGWLFIPYELAQPVFIPFVGAVPNLFTYIILTILLSLVGFGLGMVVYSLAYRVIGPPKYGPMDAPTPERKPRKR